MRSILIGLLVLAACGDSVSIDDFPTKLAAASCANAVTCKSMPDTATCKAALNTKSRLLQTIVAKVKSGAIKYDSDQAGECIEFIEGDSCTFDGFYPTTNPCTTVFTGTVAAGGACATGNECVEGTACRETDPNCDSETTCCAGTCTAVPAQVAVGGDCTTAACVDDAYCNAMNRCAAPVTTAGAPCDDFFACANPMICDVTAATATCIRPAARNATCDPMAVIGCADNRDYCDATTMKCTPVVAPGAACNGANGAECVGFADCTNMMCIAEVAAGGTCVADAMGRSNCLGDLECVGGKCTLPAAATACPRSVGSTSTSQPDIRDRNVRPAPKQDSSLHWIPRPGE